MDIGWGCFALNACPIKKKQVWSRIATDYLFRRTQATESFKNFSERGNEEIHVGIGVCGGNEIAFEL